MVLATATSSVEFSFDNTTSKHIDGITVCSPVGPPLANIFVGYYLKKLFRRNKPFRYLEYVDDTFAIFCKKSTFLLDCHCKLPLLHVVVVKIIPKMGTQTIKEGMFNAITIFTDPMKNDPQKCPVYLKFTWIGNTSLKFPKTDQNCSK